MRGQLVLYNNWVLGWLLLHIMRESANYALLDHKRNEDVLEKQSHLEDTCVYSIGTE
jgi:hypothetical protein